MNLGKQSFYQLVSNQYILKKIWNQILLTAENIYSNLFLEKICAVLSVLFFKMVHRKIAMLFPTIVSTYFFYIIGESTAHPMCIKNHIPIYYHPTTMFYITTKPNGKKG